eukprot:Mycagemm_TRINITY_DN8793_c0_g1::TRINITY_DN8793_c0_g1_i1::g.2894::m.2894 type:complete len:149 gc:universal TRINITY_DN8793_c0_g1_i1:126-572(+)
MEFPSVGKQCAQDDCKQLDFLPFKCDSCSKSFCGDHRTYAQHQCATGLAKMSQRDDLIQLHDCPLCGTHIAVRAGEDINAKVEAHIVKGCKTRCCVQKCKVSDLAMLLQCNKCHQRVCLKHRWADSHTCAPHRNIPSAPARSKPIVVN